MKKNKKKKKQNMFVLFFFSFCLVISLSLRVSTVATTDIYRCLLRRTHASPNYFGPENIVNTEIAVQTT